MQEEITVTQKHIDDGEPGLNDRCPVALALRAKGYRKVNVGRRSAFFSRKNDSYLADLPKEALAFIEKFDSGEKVTPLSFSVNLKRRR